jgi:hypothetical protein
MPSPAHSSQGLVRLQESTGPGRGMLPCQGLLGVGVGTVGLGVKASTHLARLEAVDVPMTHLNTWITRGIVAPRLEKVLPSSFPSFSRPFIPTLQPCIDIPAPKVLSLLP